MESSFEPPCTPPGRGVAALVADSREVLPDQAWENDLTATVSESVYLRTMNRAVNVTPMLDEVVQQFRAFGQNQALEIVLAVRGFSTMPTGGCAPHGPTWKSCSSRPDDGLTMTTSSGE